MPDPQDLFSTRYGIVSGSPMIPNLKNGGRVGLFMGGPALTGTALDIYNSMKAYGFPDEDFDLVSLPVQSQNAKNAKSQNRNIRLMNTGNPIGPKVAVSGSLYSLNLSIADRSFPIAFMYEMASAVSGFWAKRLKVSGMI